ncbi:DNA cytosine methyltransferase [Paenarthrobacter ilicis]|uniref:DNA cytosine methyltransferase n=1 Tax=Paenarthrobacter ilicis TaxID=43665 RepID=UPI00386D8C82
MLGNLRVVEICAGAGGQSLGLELAGFDHELAVELDETAVGTLRHNRPNWKVAQGDVADAQVWNPLDYAPGDGSAAIELLAGGVPCPPFSLAGKQLGAHDERDLFAWAVEQTAVLQPRALLLENVRGLSMPRFAGYRQHVLDRLRSFGYVAEWRLLQASGFGVAQLRPRFVLVAMRPEDFEYFHWPQPLPTTPTVGEVLLPLMSERGWRGAQAWARGADRVAPTVVGGSKKHGGADLGPTRAKKAWAELGVDGRGIANAAPTGDDAFDIGPRLTNAMVARVQGWDDESYVWEFTGKKTSVYRQIGNAFPPPVARSIGQQIAAALKRTANRRELSSEWETDPLYTAMRTSPVFLTVSDLTKKIGLRLTPAEVLRRVEALGRDFEIQETLQGEAPAYKLGRFKAFVGQDDHGRHDYFKSHLSKIS